jgi:hypothetical protein
MDLHLGYQNLNFSKRNIPKSLYGLANGILIGFNKKIVTKRSCKMDD